VKSVFHIEDPVQRGMLNGKRKTERKKKRWKRRKKEIDEVNDDVSLSNNRLICSQLFSAIAQHIREKQKNFKTTTTSTSTTTTTTGLHT
jgi:hypothetical protein